MSLNGFGLYKFLRKQPTEPCLFFQIILLYLSIYLFIIKSIFVYGVQQGKLVKIITNKFGKVSYSKKF